MPLFELSRRGQGFFLIIWGLKGSSIVINMMWNYTISIMESLTCQATVTSVKYTEQPREWTKRQKPSYEVFVKIKVPYLGKEIKSAFLMRESYAVGDVFDVLYDPNDPNGLRIRDDSGAYIPGILITLLGFICMFMGWIRL
jgi:hypothetical protein